MLRNKAFGHVEGRRFSVSITLEFEIDLTKKCEVGWICLRSNILYSSVVGRLRLL